MKFSINNIFLLLFLFCMLLCINPSIGQIKRLPLNINVNSNFLEDSIGIVIADCLAKKGFTLISNQEKEKLMQKRMEEVMARVYKEKITDESRIQKLINSGSAVANRLIINAFFSGLNNEFTLDSLNYVIQPVLGREYSKLPVINRINCDSIINGSFKEKIIFIVELIASKENEKKDK